MALPSEPKILDTFAGSTLDIRLPRHGKVQINRINANLARTQISANGKVLRITPLMTGSGVLSLKEIKTGRIIGQYLIYVNDPVLRVIQSQIRRALNAVDGIRVEIAGGRVVIDGQVISSNQINRIYAVAKMYGEHVRSLVTMSPDADTKLARVIEREINDPNIRVQIVNGHILLQGTANTLAQAERAELIAGIYAPNVVMDEAVADRKILKIHPN